MPPHLMGADRNMPMPKPEVSKPDVKPKAPSPSPLIETRSNVFDGDEFDVIEKDQVDLSRVHRGKRSDRKNANSLLEEKSDLVGLKDRFAQLSIVVDEELITPGAQGGDEYDDEYDDTYDDNAMGEREPDSDLEDMLSRRKFVLPQALGGGHIRQERQDNTDEDSDETEGKPQLDFCRNPEDIRQEAERKRQEKTNRSKNQHRPPPHKDLVGKPKGQGQDKQVQINRARKNANKGKHHRVMADKKMAKGMF